VIVSKSITSHRSPKRNVSNGGLWLKYKSLYGDREFDIGNCRNARGLGKSKVVFHLFEKLRYSNERSTNFESLNQEYKYLEQENGKMVAL